MENKIIVHSSPVYYQSEGQGYPVLLIHGFAEDRWIWRHQAEHLKDKFRVIIPEIPGSGASPRNDRLSGIAGYAVIIGAILESEKIENCILIGHSMGGYISLAFALENPGRLKGLGLFHSTAFPDTEEKKALRRKSIEFIRANGSAAFIRQTTPNLFSEATRKNHPELVENLIARYSGFDPAALIDYYEAMIARLDRTDVLRNAEVPVLWILGEEDKAVPLQDGLKQTHLASQSFIHILPDTAHMGMLEFPAESNRFLEEFIQRILINKSK